MTFIQTVTENHVPPEVTGVAQISAVETDLVVTFGHSGLVSVHDAIVGQERGDHVNGVGPREGMSWWGGWSGLLPYQSWS